MFDPNLSNTFKLFSLQHFAAIFVIASIITVIYVYRVQLRNSKYFNFVRITLATLILLQELSLNLYRVMMGEWSLSTSLPFHLCGLGVLTTAAVLLTQNKKLFINTFFIMMIGAFFAILTPSIENGFGFPHYRYFQFFISHGLIVINFTFILFVMDYAKDFEYRHLLNNFIVLIVIAIFAYLVNLLVDGNYLFLMAKPEGDTAFDLFGEYPWYILNILIFGIPLFFHLFYLPFFIAHLKEARKLAKVNA